MKYFRMSYKEVVFERSYINLLLLNAAIPGMKPHDEESSEIDIDLEDSDNNGAEEHARNYFMNFM